MRREAPPANRRSHGVGGSVATDRVTGRGDLDEGTDESLDRLGCIQISKAAGGGRPSRWILPAHIPVALAQLQATPLANTLRVLAQENRDMRMSEAEKKAAGLPPKLTVPMILFFLPVLFIVILGPAAIQISGNLLNK